MLWTQFWFCTRISELAQMRYGYTQGFIRQDPFVGFNKQDPWVNMNAPTSNTASERPTSWNVECWDVCHFFVAFVYRRCFLVIQEHPLWFDVRVINIMKHQCILPPETTASSTWWWGSLLMARLRCLLLSVLVASFHRNWPLQLEHQGFPLMSQPITKMWLLNSTIRRCPCAKARIDCPGPIYFFCHGMSFCTVYVDFGANILGS